MTTMDYGAVLVREPSIDAVRPVLEERARTGADRYDEVWEGVLHLVPPPSDDHGTLLIELAFFLEPESKRRGGRLVDGPGLRPPGTGTSNFRVPDLVYLSPEDEAGVCAGWIEGGLAVAFEIRSPRDESYAKMPFYASRGVRELVVIDREEREIRIFASATRSTSRSRPTRIAGSRSMGWAYASGSTPRRCSFDGTRGVRARGGFLPRESRGSVRRPSWAPGSWCCRTRPWRSSPRPW